MDATMKKRMVDAAQWIVFMPLVFLFAILGPSAKDIDEARASEAWEPSKDATAKINSEACVCGQAIACVVPGSETQLAKEYDSVESLLKIDAQSSSCGPCDLVLVRSSSRTVEELVAKLEASEAVFLPSPIIWRSCGRRATQRISPSNRWMTRRSSPSSPRTT